MQTSRTARTRINCDLSQSSSSSPQSFRNQIQFDFQISGIHRARSVPQGDPSVSAFFGVAFSILATIQRRWGVLVRRCVGLLRFADNCQVCVHLQQTLQVLARVWNGLPDSAGFSKCCRFTSGSDTMDVKVSVPITIEMRKPSLQGR